METKGIEPSFRRCDRHVLPLHHVPGITNLPAIVPKSHRWATVFTNRFWWPLKTHNYITIKVFRRKLTPPYNLPHTSYINTRGNVSVLRKSHTIVSHQAKNKYIRKTGKESPTRYFLRVINFWGPSDAEENKCSKICLHNYLPEPKSRWEYTSNN